MEWIGNKVKFILLYLDIDNAIVFLRLQPGNAFSDAHEI